MGEYGDNGKENGNYYSILGLYLEKFAQLGEEINTVQALGQNCVLLAGAVREGMSREKVSIGHLCVYCN